MIIVPRNSRINSFIQECMYEYYKPMFILNAMSRYLAQPFTGSYPLMCCRHFGKLLSGSTNNHRSVLKYTALRHICTRSRPNTVRRVATCKPGKPGLTSFSETLALFFIQFLSFRKMKVQDRQNDPSGLPEKNWLATRLIVIRFWYSIDRNRRIEYSILFYTIL